MRILPLQSSAKRLWPVLARFAFIFALGFSYCEGAETKRPNILFAMADDWGWPHAGAYGDPVVATPSFDRLAREGVLFENAYVSSPSCTPSRNAVLTGQQFYRLEEGANLWSTLDVDFPNFMYLLEENGYEIGHWRKSWGPGDYTLGGYKESPCGPNADFESFLAKRDSSKPFCFWFGTSDPHRAYDEGIGVESGIDVEVVPVPDFYPDDAVIRSDIADYYWEVQRWDSDVGEALALLEEAGELENTIVVMTGDHGMPFPRCKGNLYDWGTRVPLAIRWGEKVDSGRRVTDFVSLTDLAPTFLTAAGVEIPDTMTGSTLQAILESPASGRVVSERDFVVTGRERHVPAQRIPSMDSYPMRGIRTDEWLLIMNLEPERWPAGVPSDATHPMNTFADCDNGPSKAHLIGLRDNAELGRYYELSFSRRPSLELYDCLADQDQTRNLAGDVRYADVVRRLRGQLEAYLKETKDPRFTDAPVLYDKYRYTGKNVAPHLEKLGFAVPE